MPKKRMSAEEIVVLLRQIEVQTGQGKTIQGLAVTPGNWGKRPGRFFGSGLISG